MENLKRIQVFFTLVTRVGSEFRRCTPTTSAAYREVRLATS